MRDPKIVSYNMSRIGSRDTKPELALRRALHARGLRYRVHEALPGKPDIVFRGPKVVVFVDGEFWHGKDFDTLTTQLKTRRDFWLRKIRTNMERDRRNDRELARMGYKVLRFWGRDILQGPDAVAEAVKSHMICR